MDNITDSRNGFVVFEDGFIKPISYGASEKWFPTYDEAVQYAIELVSKRSAESKKDKWLYSVTVYEAEKSVLEKSHSCPCGRVVFQWNNYKTSNLSNINRGKRAELPLIVDDKIDKEI